jgi:CBS domain-containing protein
MVLVKQLLAQKSDQVYSVTPNTSLRRAIQEMADHDIGVVVVLEGTSIKGIFSERDFIRDFAGEAGPSLDAPISDLMTAKVISVTPEQTIDDCMILMTENHIRHLPVTRSGRLIGLISIGDLVKELIAERDSTIRGLENYIMGTEYNR